jgi:glycosyltransferase involved in cell wall biosynthesis
METGTPAPQAPAARVLYLSYDGMCDQLGASQVLPYLFGLAERGHEISLVSFEKPERTARERAAVEEACTAAGIRWHPLLYHKRPAVLSSMYDVGRMASAAKRLHTEQRFDLVHCRSYLPALVGLRMKRGLGVPFVFDMRGFWADERVDGRIWALSNPVFRAVFQYFKHKEAEFLAEAAHVVSLTQEGRKILLGRRPNPSAGPPISVIPCCVDFGAFPPVSPKRRTPARALLNISPDATVAAYLGSFGSWYLVDEMFNFVRVQLEREPESIFLIVSRDPASLFEAAAVARGVPADRLVIRSASRPEVPKLIAAADYGLFFIMPVFSKKASSPTKMGELLALELPIVTNGDVGDVSRIMNETGAGVVVEKFADKAYRNALLELEVLAPNMQQWREAAHRWFDLDRGVGSYDAIYRSLLNSSPDKHHAA